MTPPQVAATLERVEHRLSTTVAASRARGSADARPIPFGSWKATFAGGIFKLLIAALALSLPLLENRPLPMWVGGMLLAGGLAELAVGWTARHSVVGKVAFGSGAMTVIAGLFFMGAVSMGLPQLTVLTMVWLAVRGLISAVLAFNWRSSRAARTLLLVRGGADLALSIALVAGVSVAQIAFILFGGTPAMVIGFLVIVAISFGVAGVGLVAIAIAERAWEQALSAVNC
jgi:uncharacterized membrane protein HdeD (DUF308 family)